MYAIPARPKRRIGNGKAPEDVSREELIIEVLLNAFGVGSDVPHMSLDKGAAWRVLPGSPP